MKNFKAILLIVVALMGWNVANAMTVAEKAAQKEVKDYLTRQGFRVEIDPDDDSVMFRQSDLIYWITFKGDGSGILYTLHVKPLKLRAENDDDDTANRKHERAVYAANELNRISPAKTEVRHTRVDFTFPVFASSASEYIKQLSNVLKELQSARSQFHDQFKKMEYVTDSVHNYWSTQDPNLVVLPQRAGAIRHKVNPDLSVSNVEIATYGSYSNSEANKPLIDYNGQIFQDRCRFIREKITVRANEAGKYYIGVKLYNPEGKLIVPNKHSEFTTVTPIEIKKANKEVDVELNAFGTPDTSFWTPGVYRLEIYDSDVLVRKEAFEIYE